MDSQQITNPARRARRATIRQLQAITDQSNVGFCQMDAEARIADCNPAFAKMLGHTRDQILGSKLCSFTPAEDCETARTALKKAVDGGETEILVRRRFSRGDGSIIWLGLTLSIDRSPETDSIRLFAIAIDLTEQVKTEESLAESENRYRQLIDTMPSGTAMHKIICDAEGEPVDYEFISVNPAFELQTGLIAKDILGRTVKDVLPATEPFWIETYGKVALTGEPTQFEHYSRELERHFLVSAYCPETLHFAVLVNDITEQKRIEKERETLERQVLHAQKLESLGVLAGGIAHDFNNLLMAILGNADLALEGLEPDAPSRRELHEIEKASRRAANLCQQMLAYSGKGEFIVEAIDVCELIRDIQGMLDVSISKRAVLKLDLEDVPAVEADATQIQQVLMNLIINASEAISSKSGLITVTTGTMWCDRAYLQSTYLDEDVDEGPFVFIEISDNGCGMAPDVCERIFEPFFSTKFVGRGLGMAAVLGIVRGHRGVIKVYSEPGKGTTFKVLFPASDKNAIKKNDPPTRTRLPSNRHETILLVDDEEVVLTAGTHMLEKLGFSVISACDGQEAVDCYRASKEPIDCVVLDLTMPTMDGYEAFRELRAIDKNVRVVLSSGYNESHAVGQFNGKGLAGFIQKPYRTQHLLTVLEAALS